MDLDDLAELIAAMSSGGLDKPMVLDDHWTISSHKKPHLLRTDPMVDCGEIIAVDITPHDYIELVTSEVMVMVVLEGD